MSIQSEINRISSEVNTQTDLISQIKTALEGKTAVGAPAEVEEKDVNFYDYDGTLLYSYTLAEAQSLIELPPLPSHDGLICQGWNWDLEDVKALDQFMVIGANYITDDGKTRLYISIEYDKHLSIPLHIRQSVSNCVEIDWGDGSVPETISGTGEVNATHTYAQIGEYVIRLNVTSGSVGFGSSSGSVFGTDRGTALKKVEFGGFVSSSSYGIGAKAFYKQRRLESITITKDVRATGSDAFSGCCGLSGALVLPQGVDTWSTYWCYDCASLKIVSFPKSQTQIGNSSIRECRSLKYVALYRGVNTTYGIYNYGLQNTYSLRRIEQPDSAPELRTSAFDGCYSLTEFTVKRNIVTINSNALRNCGSLVYLRFLPTTPPTVINANAFTGIPTTCIIEVPAGCLEAYTTATNYPSAETYTYVEASE